MISYTPTSQPTAAPCLSCGDPDLYARSLCRNCYSRAWEQGIATRYPACGAVPVPCQAGYGEFEGFPDGYTPLPTGWPEVAALDAPLHPPLPAGNRWGHVVWFTRPQHDPIGQRLFDAETRYVEVEAA